jgi:hypothetical protein
VKLCDHEPEDLFQGNTTRRKVCLSDIIPTDFSAMGEVKVWMCDETWPARMPVIAEDFALAIIPLTQGIQRVCVGERLHLKGPTLGFISNHFEVLADSEGETFVTPEFRRAIAERQRIWGRGGVAPTMDIELLARDAGERLLQGIKEIADGFSGVSASHLWGPYRAKGSSSATYITSD